MDRPERPRFLAGIVEGFYGRPWTPSQRKDLFRRMKNDFAMDCYMYAPKDDYKHRSSWRELYTASECDQLRRLLLEAENHRIEFFYSLSPGLDMVYSSERDRHFLKGKYEQVAQLGCSKFAILFDDIEPQLQPSDRHVYQSFAEAHVSVANEIYEHLGRPRFLFCPTEYCGTRAVPSVKDSEYLNSIGLNLHGEIDVMWTGPQVISKTISVESLLELGKVLRRKPVIWDNLHANDYDQRRLFLGPYNRDGKMISCINGIFTNPNCEFESNFNAFYTLGCWLRSTLSTSDSGEICDELANYDPRAALCKSIKEWLKEFCVRRRPDDYSSVTAGSTVPAAEALSKSYDINLVNTLAGTILTDKDSTLKSADCREGGNDDGGKSNQIMESEPMDFVTDSPQHRRPESREDTGEKIDVLEVKQSSAVGKNKFDPEPVLDTVMRFMGGEEVSNAGDNARRLSPGLARTLECLENMDGLSGSLDDEMGGPDGNKITEDDLMLLADLFYLPFEHGEQAISLLEDVRWLRRNAPRLIEGNRKLARNRHGSLKDDSLIKREWQQRAKAFEDHYNRISRMCLRITNSTNKILVYELFPYFWDVKGILSLLNTFIKWLGSAPTFGKNPFLEDSQEPWLQRGGLFAEFQRLLPLDVYSNDPLFVSMPQEIPSAKVYTIRPYLPADERDVYEVCRRAGRDLCPKSSAYRDLIGDCLVGGFLALSADFCFVLEDDRGEICGYVACAPNAKSFKRDSEVSFRTELRKKYPNSALALEDVKEDDAKSIRSLVEQLHLSEPDLDESVQKKYPGLVRIGLLDAVSDPNIAKRLLACALSALKLNGVTGVHVPVDAEDRSVIEFFTKLGFVDLPPSQQVLKDSVVMARSM